MTFFPNDMGNEVCIASFIKTNPLGLRECVSADLYLWDVEITKALASPLLNRYDSGPQMRNTGHPLSYSPPAALVSIA